MTIDSEIQKRWQIEVEDFIARWETETEQIRNQTIEPAECRRISDNFHKDFNGLLVRSPPGLSHTEVVSRLEELDNKVNTTIAMACGWKRTEDL